MRVAIAGCHRMLSRTPAHHNWAAGFAAVPETEVVAVFDRGAETRDAFRACWGDVPAFDDYQRMVTETGPDIVCIATRQTMHADEVEGALNAGVRGILCDKPLATTLAETDRIVAACRERGVPLAFGLTRRWSRRWSALHALVTGGTLGGLQGIVVGGLPNLINLGCHLYDAALWLAGDPEIEWVSGLVDDVSQDAPESPRRRDPAGRALVGLAGGVNATFIPEGKPGASFEVLAERGRLLLLNDDRDAFLWTVEPATRGGRPISVHAPRPIELPPPSDAWAEGAAAVRDLLRAVETGGRTACDVEQARRATEVGFAIHASSARGGARLRVGEVERSLRIVSHPWGNE